MSLLLIVSEFTLDKKWALSEKFWPFEGDGLICGRSSILFRKYINSYYISKKSLRLQHNYLLRYRGKIELSRAAF